MTVADLIAELQRLPGHLRVACAEDIGAATDIDVTGAEVTVNRIKQADCYGLGYVENMGTWVRLVADGPHYG